MSEVKEVSKAAKADKKIVLNRAEYNRLVEMFKSPDKENHNVALGILEHCDVKQSLPYVLTLYKMSNELVDGGWAKGSPELMKKIKAAGVTIEGKLTMNKIWSIIKDKYSDVDIMIAQEFMASEIQSHLTAWGFVLLKDQKMILTKP